MQYQPTLPKENNNITHTHPFKEFATLVAGLVVVFLLIYILLGFLVDNAVNKISPELETDLFNHTPLSRLITDPDPPDPRQTRLQQITDEMRKCVGIDIPITVHIHESVTVNAIAVPGGHIIVYTGLLETMTTENGLSFILAHELGHFKNRDHLRGMGRGLVLMIMASAITGPNSSLTRLVTPTMQLSQAQYSQDREAAADEIGLHGLYCYYGHVGGATNFFESMAASQNSDMLSHYFGSHPEMQERIATLQALATKNSYPATEPKPLFH